MPKIIADLQEGFNNDTVLIFIDGKQVFKQEPVSTRYQIGLAGRFESEISPGIKSFKVLVANRGLSLVIELNTTHDIYLGVSVIKDGKLNVIKRNNPFQYM